MGTTLTSIHIFSDAVPKNCNLAFRSFSRNWQTCIEDLSEQEPGDTYKAAMRMSKQTDAPVLYFSVFDSDWLWFAFLRNGKLLARYSDNDFVSNKRLYEIPSLIGYQEGQKRRLSSILACSDIDLKIQMLEEYLGVCLLFSPELMDVPEAFLRKREDVLFRKYQEEEKTLTGKAAPVALKLVVDYPGKLFLDTFGNHDTMKPHYFLWGYTAPDDSSWMHKLTPVYFSGKSLDAVSISEFTQGRIPRVYSDPRFELHFGTPCKVTFSESCPAAYSGKTMTLPNGFFPFDFTRSGKILLQGNHRIYVADASLKVVAKLTIKGDIVDMVDDYILTTTGDSFCGYCYEPKTKIRIYQLLEKNH